MTPSKIQFSTIRYNPAFSAFETRASIEEDGVAYVYPVHVSATLTADFSIITRGLAEKARKMHSRRNHSLHMRKADALDIPTNTHAWAA